MNHFTKTLAALAITSLCGAASAQASFTLYGVLDVGMDFTNNSGGKKLWNMRDGTSDGMYGSRWGVRGEEDLGGGLKALFKLESGFRVDSGTLAQGGRQFGRQSWVALSSATLGTLTLGRQYDSIVDYLQPVSMDGNWGGLAFHAGDVDNIADSYRVNNAIKYTSPRMAGLQFGGMASLAESNAAGASTLGMWSAGASYATDGFNVSAGYLSAKQPAALFTDGDFVANTTGSAIGAHGAFSYVGTPSKQQIFGAGATWTLSSTTLGADFTSTRFADANGTSSTVRFDNYEAWGSYALSKAATIAAGYTFTDGRVGYSSSRPKYHQLNLMADYKLNKSTELYVSTAYQVAAGAAQPAAIFDGVVGDASSTQRQLVLRLGVVHKF
ncbi:porin [Roseateles aquatilis]|uniref:Porin n=1 Tax=Roseateles aquatilis TaxID=431061 RepID=A0A246JFA2_9BURK|nr:porin [Roseateles aquatilis]MBY0366336.1 porin [Burkholderiaceae bacterium]OWQ90936.1 porin [Roseateles aquatilis]